MSIVVTFIGEIPVRLGREIVFVNSWCREHIFGAGEDGISYVDTNKQVRINPRMLLMDFEAVAARVETLGGGKWTRDQVRTALTLPLDNLLSHFDVERGALGTIVRVSRAQRARLQGDSNVNYKARIPHAGLQDLTAQNGGDAGRRARTMAERAAIVVVANVVSRVRA